MQNFTFHRFTIFLLLFNLFTRFTFADKGVRYMTSNGVVYSYAVVTSTLQPATILRSTSAVTTVRSREVTMVAFPKATAATTTYPPSKTETTELNTPDSDRSFDTHTSTTTKDVTDIVVITSTTEITETLTPPSTPTSEAHDEVVATTGDAMTTTTTSTTTDYNDSVNTTQLESNNDGEKEPSSSSSSSSSSSPVEEATTSSSITETLVQGTGSEETPEEHPENSPNTHGTITTETTHSRTTLEPTATSTNTETESANIVPITTGREGSICYVYFDDPNDEYYSTVYITDPAQEVDAATTLTSTLTRTITSMIARQT